MLGWFSSYLGGGKQLINVQSTFLAEESVNCGVPQGSILIPLLFTLYEMASAIRCDQCLYADYSILLVSSEKNVTDIENSLKKL